MSLGVCVRVCLNKWWSVWADGQVLPRYSSNEWTHWQSHCGSVQGAEPEAVSSEGAVQNTHHDSWEHNKQREWRRIPRTWRASSFFVSFSPDTFTSKETPVRSLTFCLVVKTETICCNRNIPASTPAGHLTCHTLLSDKGYNMILTHGRDRVSKLLKTHKRLL